MSNSPKTTPSRPVGLTQSVGYEIGVRKTFNVPPQQAWDFITSPAGLATWLGQVHDFKWQEGHTYQTSDGAVGELRVLNPGGHFRLTWQPKGWVKPSLIQLRITPRGVKTVIGFHQEHLSGPQQREAMRKRWQQVLEELQTVFGAGES